MMEINVKKHNRKVLFESIKVALDSDYGKIYESLLFNILSLVWHFRRGPCEHREVMLTDDGKVDYCVECGEISNKGNMNL